MPNSQQVRTLWLESFFHDLPALIDKASQLGLIGFSEYPAIRDTMRLLQTDFQKMKLSPEHEETNVGHEVARLDCLLLLSILLQESMSLYCRDSSTLAPPSPPALHSLSALNDFLGGERKTWQDSVKKLHNLLFSNETNILYNTRTMSYASQITNILWLFSDELRQGVEASLLDLLGETEGDQ